LDFGAVANVQRGCAIGGRQAVAVANEALLARQRMAEHIGALELLKQRRR